MNLDGGSGYASRGNVSVRFMARNYDPAIGRWFNMDPLAEVSRKFSHVYALDNPVYFIDHDGMMASNGYQDIDYSSFSGSIQYSNFDGGDDLIITGSHMEQAFGELQKSQKGQLNLSMDSNGKLDYTRGNMIGPLTKGAHDLMNAIDDTTITTIVEATDNDFVSDESGPLLGSFRGNKFTTPGPIFTVEAKQEINQPALERWDEIAKTPGQTTLHETTEPYKGATISQQTGRSAGPATFADQQNDNSIFWKAHVSVTPQSGTPTAHFFDAQGNEVYRQQNQSVPGAVRIEYRINGQTFHHVPKK